MANFQKIHQRLLDPATYPEPTTHVDFRETHISRVYLTDTCAYKLKKPLDLGFLDFSTLERRAFFCAEEVRLNRRFAPEIYLGVAELRESNHALRFNGSGKLVECAVRMRRLPEKRMLDRLLDAGDPDLPAEITRLARHLAAILASTVICRNEGGRDYAAIVRANIEENLAQTVSAIGHALSTTAHHVMTTLATTRMNALEPLLRSREEQGYVRDGHGDLHARNICMTDPIQVYDCIEFCRHFRVADITAELAFLLMDLDFRGRRDLTERFLTTYQEHVADPDLVTLLPFFKSYRAWVRGKVDTLLAGEAEVEPDMRRQAMERSGRYFNLALGYHVPPTLLLTAGLMGVGKTTLSRGLEAALGAELLRSDLIRKELTGIPPAVRQPDAFNAGLYTPEMTARTYAEMRRRAVHLLERGKTVIIDASFARETERLAFLDLAGEMGTPARLIHLHCDRMITMARLERREAEGRDASDGRRELLQLQADAFETINPGPQLIEVDSFAAVDYNVQKILCRLLTR